MPKSKKTNELDQFYTPSQIAEACVQQVQRLIGDQVTQYLEPSAGAGVFLDYLPADTVSYDIEPHDPRITQADFLTLDVPYHKGRCVIGNPPFGIGSMKMAAKFFRKAITLGDFVAFILPISQLNDNDGQIYQFDLIYSQALPAIEFSGKIMRCCFNLYQRPLNGVLRKRSKFLQLEDCQIYEQRRGTSMKYIEGESYRMSNFGCVNGKTQSPHQTCTQIVYLLKEGVKEAIIHLLQTADYGDISPCVAGKAKMCYSVRPRQIQKYLKEKMPHLK